MLKQLNLKIENINSLDDKVSLEADLEVKNGVEEVSIDEKSGRIFVRFDESIISEKEIIETIGKSGFSISADENVQSQKDLSDTKRGEIKEHLYSVKGMHCASCEVLIEKNILKLQGVKSVEASTNKGEVLVEYKGERPFAHQLNKLFREEKYTFFDTKIRDTDTAESKSKKANPNLSAFAIAMVIIAAFLALDRMGVAKILNVNSASSLFVFFGLGVLAGVSSCAALVGGIVLSMSKQWQGLYSRGQGAFEKFQPHLLFNIGRILSYGVFGAVLGMIGSKLQISLNSVSFLVIGVSVLMLALGLQMLGVKYFRKFQITVPKFMTRYVADEENFQGKYMPFLMGAGTFFLPCGFTIVVQGLAVLSGDPVQGSLMLLVFALGTAPMLLLIGASSVKFSSRPHLSEKFAKVAGFIVIFFALFNINNQATVLGFSGFDNVLQSFSGQSQVALSDTKDFPQVINGKQIVKTTVYSVKYEPNYIKVRAGVPIRWEITTTNQPGCATAGLVARGLFNDVVDLVPGQVSVKEFTPEKQGRYRFTCLMGMVTGTIEVVGGGT